MPDVSHMSDKKVVRDISILGILGIGNGNVKDLKIE